MRLSRPCLLVLVCSLVLLSGSAAHAQPSAVSTTVDFSRSDVTLTRAGTYDVVRLAGSVTTVDVGAPELPLSIVTLALPEGTVAVSADAQVLDRSELGTGFVVRPVQPGCGHALLGQHEILLPLLRQAVVEALQA